jgi:hypothetical protein
MRVICNSDSGRSLSKGLLALGYTPQSNFAVSIGREYRVYAMSLWQGVIMVLLKDDTRLPNWFPIPLFTVTDSHLPENWLFSSHNGDESCSRTMWGYDKLVTDVAHYDLLIEKHPEALKIFYEEEKHRVSSTEGV